MGWGVATVSALDNGAALLPPMGFANWNGFGCHYDDATFRQQADFLNSSGLAAAGYRTMIIQECITVAGHRDPGGVPQPDPVKFPHGIKGLCDYIHSKGLLCGIYTDVGPKTCAGYEGSYNHEAIDAQTYASWGIDFVEEDSCHHGDIQPYIPYHTLYGRMRDALNATGRRITFYACVQGQEDVYQWGPTTANLWRTTGDICGPGHASWGGMIRNFYGNAKWPNATMPGAWQDADMLVVGMAGLTVDEWKTHFSLWAVSANPLWAGIDLTKANQSAIDIFLNKEVIAVDQDPLGEMAACRSGSCSGGPPPEHPAVALCSCSAASGFKWNPARQTIDAPDGNVVTTQNCGAPSGDNVIMYQYVPNSCHPLPTSNQQFALRNTSGGAFLISPAEDPTACLIPNDGATAVVVGACGATSTWTWTTNGQLALANAKGVCMTAPGAVPSKDGQVWARPLSTHNTTFSSKVAVVLFNPADSGTNVTVTATAEQLGLDANMPAQIRDVWAHENLPPSTTVSASLAPHSSSMFVLAQ